MTIDYSFFLNSYSSVTILVQFDSCGLSPTRAKSKDALAELPPIYPAHSAMAIHRHQRCALRHSVAQCGNFPRHPTAIAACCLRQCAKLAAFSRRLRHSSGGNVPPGEERVTRRAAAGGIGRHVRRELVQLTLGERAGTTVR